MNFSYYEFHGYVPARGSTYIGTHLIFQLRLEYNVKVTERATIQKIADTLQK